jgi:UDP-GlcNAc:undecaprenyl-phosphate GlcNAc-1-phosphate transferase
MLGFAVALLLALLLTPVAIRIAERVAFFDAPVGYKKHGSPTPYLGGAAVVAAFLVASLVAAAGIDAERALVLGGGAAALWAVGTVDDWRTVAPRVRVGIEIALAVALWATGLGWETGAGGWLDALLTAVWIVGVVNAFNLFDNMDGAAGSQVVAVGACVAAFGAIEGDAWLAATGAALAGSSLGFLPLNLAGPAKIFLGDGGSMPVGFVAATLAMAGSSDVLPIEQALPFAVLLVALPLLDTASVVVSRTRRGVSLLTGGQDHLTYRAKPRLGTPRRVAITLGATQAVVGSLAVAAAETSAGAVWAAAALAAAAGVATIARLERGGDVLPRAATPSADVAPAHGVGSHE